jgi:hypothetical protein
MSKIRMNTEYRNKLYNRIKDVFEKEDTQERQAFMESREQFNEMQGHASMVMSMAKMKIESILLTHTIVKNSKPTA